MPLLGATNSFLVTVAGPVVAPVIQSITVSNNLVTIIASGMDGRIYRLQSIGGLVQTNWTDLFPEATAVAGNVVLTNTTGAAAESYYRVFLVPLP